MDKKKIDKTYELLGRFIEKYSCVEYALTEFLYILINNDNIDIGHKILSNYIRDLDRKTKLMRKLHKVVIRDSGLVGDIEKICNDIDIIRTFRTKYAHSAWVIAQTDSGNKLVLNGLRKQLYEMTNKDTFNEVSENELKKHLDLANKLVTKIYKTMSICRRLITAREIRGTPY